MKIRPRNCFASAILSSTAGRAGRVEGAGGVRVSRRIPLGGKCNVDAIFEVFNLFDRTNFTDVNNIFGTGAYPGSPLPTFGQFQQAGSPRQVQLAVKIGF